MITIETDNFLNIEKKHLFKKITIYVGNKINETTDYTKSEIAEYIGVALSRISEWTNFENYQQPLSGNDLKKCIDRGIVTIDELIENCVETDKERDFLNGKSKSN